jgi:hypothetical protein
LSRAPNDTLTINELTAVERKKCLFVLETTLRGGLSQ